MKTDTYVLFCDTLYINDKQRGSAETDTNSAKQNENKQLTNAVRRDRI